MDKVAVLVKDDVVVNRILVGDDYQPPEGVIMVDVAAKTVAEIGMTYDGKAFARPAVPAKTADELRMDELRAKATSNAALTAADVGDAVRIILKTGRVNA